MEHFYVGSCTEFLLQGQKFERLGDKIAFKSDDAANEAIRGGAQFITSAEFEQCGFTSDELRKYPYPGRRLRAPEEFKAKLEKATDFFRDRCNRLRTEQVAIESASPALIEPEPEPEPEPEQVEEVEPAAHHSLEVV